MKEKDILWWAFQMSALMIIVWNGLDNRDLVVMGLSYNMLNPLHHKDIVHLWNAHKQ